MPRVNNRVSVAGVIVLLTLVVVYLGFYWYAANKRAAALDHLEKPDAYRMYDLLYAQVRSPEAAHGEAWAGPVPQTRAMENLAAFEELFEYLDTVLAIDPALDACPRYHAGLKYEWTSKDLTAVRWIAETHADFAERVRAAAAAGGPVYALNLNDGLEIELPHLERMRNLVRFMRANAIDHVLEGEHDAAARDIITIIQLGEALRYEPILVSQGVRMRIYQIGFGTAKEWLDGGALSEDVFTEFVEHVKSAYEYHAYEETLLGEALKMDAVFQEIRRDPERLTQWFEVPEGYFIRRSYRPERQGNSLFTFASKSVLNRVSGWSDTAFTKGYPSPFMRPWLNLDEADCINALIAYAELGDRPYHQLREDLESLGKRIAQMPNIRIISKIVVPEYGGSFRSYAAKAQNAIDQTWLGTSVDRYIHLERHPPESLQDVAEYFRFDLPKDPFTGDDYGYWLDGDAYVLYSVGGDGLDNGDYYDRWAADVVWRGLGARPPRTRIHEIQR